MADDPASGAEPPTSMAQVMAALKRLSTVSARSNRDTQKAVNTLQTLTLKHHHHTSAEYRKIVRRIARLETKAGIVPPVEDLPTAPPDDEPQPPKSAGPVAPDA